MNINKHIVCLAIVCLALCGLLTATAVAGNGQRLGVHIYEHCRQRQHVHFQ